MRGSSCNHCGTQLLGENDPDLPELICDDCMRELPVWGRGRAVFMYAGVARTLVLGLKHGDRHDLVPAFSRWASDKVNDLVSEDTVLVPVPLHPLRFAKRRFNQSALITSQLSIDLNLNHCPRALYRSRYTSSLDGKSRAERFEIMETAIQPNPRCGVSIAHKGVILVDDVMTTGATLTTCAKALMAMQARRVDILTLARVGKSP